MPWILALAILCLTFTSDASGTKKPKLPFAVVVGNVYCHTCFENDFSASNHFISGALVAVECDRKNSKPRFQKEVRTNKHGEFKVNLPFSVGKHVKKMKRCSVNLVQSSHVNCAVASTARTLTLHLKSRKSRTSVFSAGFFAFKPSTQPNFCNQKSNVKNSINSFDTDPSFPPPLQDLPPSSIIPPIDDPGQFAPIPILPRLPPLPQLPNLPPLFPPEQETNDLLNQKSFSLFPPLVPNPFQPPPAILPPIIPSPPPSIFPPIFPAPPPSIFPPFFPAPPVSPPSLFPPIPGFTPASPPPPRLFPPFPFLPPGFPGNPPPAATKSVDSKETNLP